ncbi:DUF5078 domain-containing protein [Mycobacterium simiae]|uniref:DUF5078 domain-containing protein n=1 Tax=Mycobacterium simiae TaxID=1784 RepID=UPI00165F568A
MLGGGSVPYRIIADIYTAEQILAASRDANRVYCQRYMTDDYNQPNIQQAVQDKAR